MPELTRDQVLESLSLACELERRRCEVDFAFFAQRAWHTIEPATKYVHGPHIEAIVDHLDACLPRVSFLDRLNDDGSVSKVKRIDPGHIRKLLINMPPRHMKLLADETPVPTPDGIRLHGDLRVGDRVFGSDGLPSNILSISPDSPADIEVELSTGEIIKCNRDHLWTVYDRSCASWRTVDTACLLRWRGADRARFFLPCEPSLQFSEVDLPLDPYFLGCWLGDGSESKPCITHDVNDRAHIEKIVSRGLSISTVCSGGTVTYFSRNGVIQAIRSLGLYKAKRIPEIYFQSSFSQRLELLAGLIDTDGNVCLKTSRVRYCTCDDNLAFDVERLCFSLGLRPYRHSVPAPGYGDYPSSKMAHQIGFQPYFDIPTAIPRKRIVRFVKHVRTSIVSVRESSSPSVGHCISIDREDGLYVVGRTHVLTHNSTLVSILWPAYVWTTRPEFRWLFTSYSKALSIRDTMRMRTVVMSPWYQQLWAPRFRLLPDQNEKSKFFNTAMGYRVCGSVESGVTGEGGDGVLVDDPHNVHDADSEKVREATENWWFESMSTRLNDPDTGFHVAVFQRVHEKDIAAKCKERGYVHLNLPARYDPKRSCVTTLGWQDWRKEEGELLWPARFNEPVMKSLENNLGSYGTASQLQQDPKPRGGAFIKADWFKRVDAQHVKNLFGSIGWSRSWDLALSASGDLVASIEGGLSADGNLYLRRGLAWHEDLPVTLARIEAIGDYERNRVDIEAIGTTKSAAEQARDRIRGKCMVNLIVDKTNKVSMAMPWIAMAEAGKVYLVEEASSDSSIAEPGTAPWPFYTYNKVPWIDRFLDVFTSWKPDPTIDQVDDPIDAVSMVFQAVRQNVPLNRVLVQEFMPEPSEDDDFGDSLQDRFY